MRRNKKCPFTKPRKKDRKKNDDLCGAHLPTARKMKKDTHKIPQLSQKNETYHVELNNFVQYYSSILGDVLHARNK